jgi:hypothetical protein
MSPNEELAGSICDSIAGQHNDDNASLAKGVSTYFDKSKLAFICPHEDQFKSLRESWKIGENEYYKSFQGDSNDDAKGSALVSKGDMGFSGSTFFNTADGKYLVKSVPRHFEHSFFKDELLVPYAEHMRQNLASLLVRITDFLEAKSNISSTMGMAPAHHIVMENTKFGEQDDKRKDIEWQTWDLKPMSYFYPERDVAGGALTSEETKDKLADDFSGKLVLGLDFPREMQCGGLFALPRSHSLEPRRS